MKNIGNLLAAFLLAASIAVPMHFFCVVGVQWLIK